MTDQTVSETLNRAADLIEECGWTQGPEGWRSTSGLCVEGAMAAAMGVDIMRGNTFYPCAAYAAMADYLDRSPRPVFAPIQDALWMWNDDHSRTAEQVIETLRAAALIESAKETSIDGKPSTKADAAVVEAAAAEVSK